MVAKRARMALGEFGGRDPTAGRQWRWSPRDWQRDLFAGAGEGPELGDDPGPDDDQGGHFWGHLRGQLQQGHVDADGGGENGERLLEFGHGGCTSYKEGTLPPFS